MSDLENLKFKFQDYFCPEMIVTFKNSLDNGFELDPFKVHLEACKECREGIKKVSSNLTSFVNPMTLIKLFNGGF